MAPSLAVFAALVVGGSGSAPPGSDPGVRASADSTPAPTDEQCAEKMGWFDDITRQVANLDELNPDPLFEAGLKSIGEGDCGDTASGEIQSCDDFKDWKSMKSIAEGRQKKFAVFSTKEGARPSPADINQGSLGDCYFLAAMASMAYAFPGHIERMFVKQELWEQNIFTTEWRINGKPVEVAVNDKVPAKPWGTSFGHPNRQSDTEEVYWSVIAEKAWGKIFKNYHATEGGMWGHVIAATTAANVVVQEHTEDEKEALWKLLLTATSKGWPMGSGTRAQAVNFGLVDGHAYSTLKAEEKDGERQVYVFNPWNSDGYNGALPNPDKEDGFFWMKFDEFFEAFEYTEVAEMYEGYTTKSKQVPLEGGLFSAAFEFSVTSKKPFTVSSHWPSRFMIRPCDVPAAEVNLIVFKKDAPSDFETGDTKGRRWGLNRAHVQVEDGDGTYIAFVSTKFFGDHWVKDLYFTVYAEDGTVESISDHPDAMDAVHATVLPKCQSENVDSNTITVKGMEDWDNGLYERASDYLFGLPYYVSYDRKRYLFWDGRDGGWMTVGESSFEKVKEGSRFVSDHYAPNALGVCGKADSAAVGGYTGVDCSTVKEETYNNINCDETHENFKRVYRFCPKTCDAMAAEKAALKDDPSAVMPDCGAEGDVITVLEKGGWNDGVYKKDASLGELDHIPAYMSTDGRKVMYFKPQCKGWSFISRAAWEHVKSGSSYNTECYSKDDLGKCGMHDTSMITSYGVPCVDVKPGEERYSNVKCSLKDAQRWCAGTCKDFLQDFDTSMLGGHAFQGQKAYIGVALVASAALTSAAVLMARRRTAVTVTPDQEELLSIE